MELQLKVQTYIRYKHAHHCTTKSQKHEKDCRRLFTNQIIAWDASGSKETELACHPWESSSRRGENSDKSLLSWGIFKDQESINSLCKTMEITYCKCWMLNKKLFVKQMKKAVHQLSMQHRVSMYIFDNSIYFWLHQQIAKMTKPIIIFSLAF